VVLLAHEEEIVMAWKITIGMDYSRIMMMFLFGMRMMNLKKREDEEKKKKKEKMMKKMKG